MITDVDCPAATVTLAGVNANGVLLAAPAVALMTPHALISVEHTVMEDEPVVALVLNVIVDPLIFV